MRTSKGLVAFAAFAALALTSACGSDGPTKGGLELIHSDSSGPSVGSHPASSAKPPAGHPLKAFDPPNSFASSGIALPSSLVESNVGGSVTTSYTTLSGKSAFVAGPRGVTAYDLATGAQKWSTPVANPAQSENQTGMVTGQGPSAPLVSADGSTVATAFLTIVKGSGTTTDRIALTVLGLDAASGAKKWNVSTPTDLSERTAPSTVVGLTDHSVLATASGRTRLLAISSGKVLWQPKTDQYGDAKDRPLVVDGDVFVTDSKVPGTSADEPGEALIGRSMTDGSQVWQQVSPTQEKDGTYWKTVGVVGPGLVAAVADDEPSDVVHTYDTRTGKARKTLSNLLDLFSAQGFPPCIFDRTNVSVCAQEAGIMFAVDTGTGEVLWKLPDAKNAPGREAPGLGAALHGNVYASSSNGPVIIDARTGKDKSTHSGQDVFAVNEYGGLVLGEKGAVSFVPAAS
jgi:outer membrane protein assembly factor BamB